VKPLPSVLPTLQATRLRLRPLHPGDVDALFAIYGDAGVMRHASDPPFPAPETVLEMLASVERLLAEGGSMEWAIEELQQRELIGTCGLHGFDRPTASAEVGCLLARKAWGHGYMREALIVLFDHAKQSLGLAGLRADIDATNARSLRLFAALGFEPGSAGLLERRL
jgi:RimJ/RimL family protein N-acetyltransferase